MPERRNLDPRAASSHRKKAETRHWRHLSDREREGGIQRVRDWLTEPEIARSSEFFPLLEALVVDFLVHDAFARALERYVEIDAPQKRSGPGWRRHLSEAESAAAGSARLFRTDFLDLLGRDELDPRRELLRTTMEWWTERKAKGEASDPERLINRCADQVSALLVFRHLDEMAAGHCDPNGTEEPPGAAWWPDLARRTAERILIPSVRSAKEAAGPKPPPESAVDEDRANEYVLALLREAGRFEYRGLKEALKYFTRACVLWDQEKPFQVATEPLPEGDPLPSSSGSSAALLTYGAEELFDFEETALGLRTKRRDALWGVMESALGRPKALMLWVLLILRHYYLREWEEVALLVAEDHCRIMEGDDLPPDVPGEQAEMTFGEIRARIDAMSKRSKPPGALSAEGLRKFYSRATQDLLRYVRSD